MGRSRSTKVSGRTGIRATMSIAATGGLPVGPWNWDGDGAAFTIPAASTMMAPRW